MIIVVAVCMMSLILLIFGCKRTQTAAPVDCLINEGSCAKKADGSDITVQIDMEPKPVRTMKELFFTVRISRGENPISEREVILVLTMPGMYMGKNNPKLSFVGDGTFRGTGILPRCPAGKHIWSAEVLFPYESDGKDSIASAEFTYEVTD